MKPPIFISILSACIVTGSAARRVEQNKQIAPEHCIGAWRLISFEAQPEEETAGRCRPELKHAARIVRGHEHHFQVPLLQRFHLHLPAQAQLQQALQEPASRLHSKALRLDVDQNSSR